MVQRSCHVVQIHDTYIRKDIFFSSDSIHAIWLTEDIKYTLHQNKNKSEYSVSLYLKGLLFCCMFAFLAL